MPPFQVKAGWLDYAIAWVQDYKNPLNAAAMKEVDEAGESMFGESGWKDTAFRGYIYYKSAFGAEGERGIPLLVDKECGKKMIDSAPKEPGAGGGSGSGGGYTWYGGRVYGGGECIYGCGTGKVTVGEIDPL